MPLPVALYFGRPAIGEWLGPYLGLAKQYRGIELRPAGVSDYRRHRGQGQRPLYAVILNSGVAGKVFYVFLRDDESFAGP